MRPHRALVVFGVLFGRGALAATLHVDGASASCSDAASYSSAQNAATPVCSIQRAADLVNAGDVVAVHAGTYALGATLMIKRGGTAAAPVTFRADGAVVIVGPGATGAQGVIVTGDYVTVDGFEIRGSGETGLRCSGCNHAVFRNNRVHDNGRGCATTTKCGQGIAANSAQSVGVLIENNVSYHNGSGTSLDHCYYIAGHDVVVRNNIAVDCAAYGFQIYPDCIDCDVYNNVAYGMKVQSGFVLGGEAPGTISTNLRVFNNIAMNNARHGFLAFKNGAGGITFANNLAFGNPRGAVGSTDAATLYTEMATIEADPGFVDPSALDFHLTAGSPAIDKGSTVLFAPTDIDGDERPWGPGVDIGVDEVTPAGPDGGAEPPQDGGAKPADAASDGASDGGGNDDAGPDATDDGSSGCGCATWNTPDGGCAHACAVLVLAALLRRRHRPARRARARIC